MGISESDVKFKKSSTVTDTDANGGVKGTAEIASGVRHNLFPRVTKAERVVGVTRWRKLFFCNENADDDIAYEVLFWLEHPSNAGDRFYLGEGAQTDLQSALADYDPALVGVGQLQTLLSGGETEVALTMSNDDFEFLNGGYLHLSNKFMTGQTIATSVKIGDSVELAVGTWSTIAATTDVVYPKGIYIGGNVVMTLQPASNEEWLALADNEYTDEDIGDGDGADTSPALTNLAHGTNGICRQPGKLPVVTAVCGVATKTVNIAADGTCSGYCSAGELDMTDGTWTTDITWSTAPDLGVDIEITYHENCFDYAGNVATVELETGEQVGNAYATSNTFGGGCIEGSDVEPTSDNWAEVFAGTGTYDEAGYPLTLFNDGTEEDTITLTFTSAVAFTVSALRAGALGSGDVTTNLSPINTETGQPYFTLDKDGWGGTPVAGDTVSFKTHPAAFPLWMKELVPVATSEEPYNLMPLGWVCE